MGRVLVVEDEASIRDALSAMLEDEGYEVLTAGDGLQALQQAKQSPPDLILLDLMMPVMDGQTFLAAFQEDPSYRAVPIIVLSAIGDLTKRAETLRALGVHVCLAKPVELEVLLPLVEHYAPLAH